MTTQEQFQVLADAMAAFGKSLEEAFFGVLKLKPRPVFSGEAFRLVAAVAGAMMLSLMWGLLSLAGGAGQ